MKQENTAILTCMDYNFEHNFINDFLKTLREVALYQSKVIVLDYGMSAEAIEGISKADAKVEIIRCSKDRHIFSVRFRDMAEITDKLPEEITHVMAIDGGDVWFQGEIDDIFGHCETQIGYIEDYTLDNSWWNRQLLNLMRPEEMKKLFMNFRGTRQKNAGMICGPRTIISKVSDMISKYVLNNGSDFFGLDQLYFNYIINCMPDYEKIVLPKKYNYVLIDNRHKLINEDGRIFNENHELMTVIHNAGGSNRRFIDKEVYTGFDESQYKRVIQIYK